MDYFLGKTVKIGEVPTTINAKQAKDIYRYLLKNDYVDDNDNVTDSYRADLANNALAPLPPDLQPIAEGVHTLIQGVFDERVLDSMIDNGNKTKIFEKTE
jgi:type III restriction enzyme